MINKKGQEEMVGFAMIIILVAIILLVLLAVSLNKNHSQNTDSSEVDNFMQAMLQYTTQCQDNFGYVSVKNLIFSCASGTGVQCPNQVTVCDELNSTISGIMKTSWNVGKGSPIKGYVLNVTSSRGYLISIKAGNESSSSEGTSQNISKPGLPVDLLLRVYS